ncbi:MAG TPA: ABC transporter permease [Candidatus Limnocylindrales bacterium]|nr:ABC transporter permease [Candidatus Limnocylindrales bacterium]
MKADSDFTYAAATERQAALRQDAQLRRHGRDAAEARRATRNRRRREAAIERTTTSLRWEGNALLGFIERQRNLYRRYWLWEVVWWLYSLVSVMSIGFLASGLASLGVGQAQFNLRAAQLYLLLGSLLWSFLSMVFFEIAFGIAWERWEGTIEYTFMAPVKRVTHLLGLCLSSLLYGILRGVLIAVVVVLIFPLDFSHADWGSALAILGAAILPLIGLGVFTAVLPLLSTEKGEQMTVAVQGILLLVSGVYYPLSVLPLPLDIIGHLSPLTYALAGVRDALLKNANLSTEMANIALLLALGVVLVPASIWTFSRAERRAKRLGLLKRSG